MMMTLSYQHAHSKTFSPQVVLLTLFISVLIAILTLPISVAKTNPTTTQADKNMLITTFGKPTYLQSLHYRKVYDKKPFPDAKIFYYDNGVYKILTQGENHYGLYVLSGSFTDQTYTIRFISLPSDDWGQKTAFHQLTFINNDAHTSGIFIQNAIVETGEALAQQNGTFTIEKNTIYNPIKEQWDE